REILPRKRQHVLASVLDRERWHSGTCSRNSASGQGRAGKRHGVSGPDINFVITKKYRKLLTWYHTHRKCFIHKKAVIGETGFVLESEPAEIAFRFYGQHELANSAGLIKGVCYGPIFQQLFQRQ